MQTSFASKLRLAASVLLLSLIAACATPANDAPAPTGMVLTSPTFADNTLLPRRFAGRNPANANCVGDNVSPALAWRQVPAGTKSFVLLVDDQGGRAGLGVSHWVAYGIPATLDGLPEGAGDPPAPSFLHGVNTIGRQAFLGPCPPKGNAPQHYVYTLIATRLEPNALPAGLDRAAVLKALNGQTLAAASVVLRFAH